MRKGSCVWHLQGNDDVYFKGPEDEFKVPKTFFVYWGRFCSIETFFGILGTFLSDQGSALVYWEFFSYWKDFY